MKARVRGRLNAGRLWTLIGIVIALVLLWETPVVYPVKILVVFFHELSHGLMAVATGGRILQIQLDYMQGGLCVTQGGSRFLTLSAGYLGSLVFGGIILLAATRTRWHRQAAIGLGIVVALVALLYVRPLIGFGFLFSVLAAAGLIAAGAKLNEAWNQWILLVIGLTSCLYALLDIKSDILDRPHLHSDAAMLAEITFIPGIIWGLIWLALGIAAAWHFLRIAVTDEPK